MTSANDEPDTPAQSGTDASSAVESWLDAFDSALSSGDVDAATGLFTDDGLWRDLVAFTWNIKTVEGRDQIADMLGERLEGTEPSGFRIHEEATEDGGVVSAFIEFDTAVGRGIGHLRLKDDQAWTLLTALAELKGQGAQRPVAGARRGARLRPRSAVVGGEASGRG